MTEIWQLLLTALVGIISGAVVPVILQWRSRRAEAKKITVEYRKIEDEITERVLRRAKEEISGLVLENEELRNRIRDVVEEKKKLACRVNQLEDKCVVMQAEYDRLLVMLDELRAALESVCKQLSDAGIKPAVEVGIIDEYFER